MAFSSHRTGFNQADAQLKMAAALAASTAGKLEKEEIEAEGQKLEEEENTSPDEAEAVSIALMRKMILRFEERMWVGAVQISTSLTTPLVSASFFIKSFFGKVKATVEQEVIGETKEGPKKAKWWNKRLETRLDYLDKKVKTMAFIFQSFEIRGRLGVVFSLALNTPIASICFEITIELTADCLMASLEQEKEEILVQEKAKQKLEKQKAKEQKAKESKRPLVRLASKLKEKKKKRIEEEYGALAEADRLAHGASTLIILSYRLFYLFLIEAKTRMTLHLRKWWLLLRESK